MKLLRNHSLTHTKELQLYELEIVTSGHKGWWLVLFDTMIPEKPISQNTYFSEKDAVDAFIKAASNAHAEVV